MTKIIIWQAGLFAILVAAFGVLLGANAALSCLLGGLCYLLPTTLAILLLNFFRSRARWAAISFLWGESLKVMLSIMLMVGVFWFYPALEWLPFLLGLLSVSHVVFFMIWKLHHGK